ncbi:MAG: hypothetical protein AAGG01_02545, partial [Planctomycetota bacterium]
AMDDGSLLELGTVSVSLTQPTNASEGPEGLRIAGRWSPQLGKGQATGSIWLKGEVDADRIAHIRGVAHELSLAPGSLEGLGVSSILTSLDPEAALDLECEAAYSLGRSKLPSLTSRIRVSDGRLTLPWLESASSRALEGIALSAEVSFDPEGAEGALDPEAWSTCGTLEFAWEELEGQARFRAGSDAPADTSLEV